MPKKKFYKNVTNEQLAQKLDNFYQQLSDKIDVNNDDLALMIKDGFDAVDKRFEQVDKRFEQVDRRFEQVDKRFEQVDKRLDSVELRLSHLEVDRAIIKKVKNALAID